jgi:tRNA 2-thiouridine synthesizing protein A
VSDTVIDCLGQGCPLPVIALAKAIKGVDVGEVVTVLADDPAADADIRAWCGMRGQELEGADPPAYRVKKIS